jgi:uncharacterized membrane protein
MKNKTTIKTETIFLFLSLIFGLIFAISIPAVFDESAQIVKAYDISEGNIIPNNVEVVIPNNFKLHVFGDFIDMNGNYTVNMSHQSIFSYPPLPYLASALVIKIAGFFNCSGLVITYICRIINLLIYTFIVYFAIKITPILKTALLLIALMPTSIFIAASVSGDSLTMALSFLVVALFLKLTSIKNKIQIKDIPIIFIVVLALSLTKPSYTLLSLLFCIVPHNKFKNIKNWIITFICTCLIPLSISFIWNAKFKYLYPYLVYSFNSYLQSPVYNITFVLSHPLKFIDLLINTIIFNDGYTINTILPKFVSDFGYGLQLPLFLTYVYLIVLVLASSCNVSEFKLNLKQKLIGLSVFLIIFLAINVAELITWTPISSNTIWGIQGRYFIPIAPLLFLVFNNSLKSRRLQKIYEKFNWNIIVVLYIIFFLSLSLFSIVTKQFF